MTLPELEERMREWLSGDFNGVIFEDEGNVVAYGLYREQPDMVYLQHFFVVRHRRRERIGRSAIEILRSQVWPKDRKLLLDVLIANESGLAFWRSVGYEVFALSLEITPETLE